VTLESGRNLLHYRLVEKIGAGGMGVVWNAVDTDLGREVAIKVLPDAFSRDAERLTRFRREAKLLATLNHPNIATVHGLHEADGVRFLAMELIAGEDLARLLAEGPLPVQRVVEIGRQVAEALEAAHESGIVHRDLKPANIIVRPDGQVKVLDFGLAKSAAGSSDPDISMSPTMTSAGTQAGMILGTAAYLSPEQAKGQPVDRRTDIWAYGVVLHEMLSGQRTFRGEGLSETLAAVILKEPDLHALPADTPPRVQELIRRCLVKDPRRRLRDIGEARVVLEQPNAPLPGRAAEPGATDAAPAVASRRTIWLALAAVPIVAVAAFLGGRALQTKALPREPKRLTVDFTAGEPLGDVPAPFAPSPDGSRIAFVAGGPRQLYVRDLRHLEAVALNDTKGAEQPFFSPDGEWIGFVADGKLKKVSVHGGAPLALADCPRARGATWVGDETIVYAPSTITGLHRISSAGGQPEQITSPEEDEGGPGRSHRWPWALPGGRFVLFIRQARGTSYSDASIALYDLETGEQRDVYRGGTFPLYAPGGFLVFAHDRTLFAARFDPVRGLGGRSPVPVLEGFDYHAGNGGACVALSRQGTLYYRTRTAAQWEGKVGRVSAQGAFEVWPVDPAKHRDAVLSPDGRRLAYTVVDPEEGNANIWVWDVVREVGSRLTFAEAWEWFPSWSPDGEYVLFSSARSGEMRVYRKRADGSGDVEALTPDVNSAWGGGSLSPDGRYLAYHGSTGNNASDVLVFDLDGDGEPTVFAGSEARERFPSFSQDGRWVAYLSDESGRDEVYVRPFPGPGGKWQVSREGADRAVWSRDGRTLYFEDDNDTPTIRAVEVEAGDASLRLGRPRPVFESQFEVLGGWSVGADGSLYVTLRETEQEEAAAARGLVNVVFDWPTELERLVPR
jgi:serine/threonine-protein kinase